MIDGSEKPNHQFAFELQNSFVCEKCSKEYCGVVHRCRRLLVGLVEYMQLQDVMAWLSTLGGAYSAMGEHFCSYVSV